LRRENNGIAEPIKEGAPDCDVSLDLRSANATIVPSPRERRGGWDEGLGG
jgi:hypothetical protein